MKSGLGLFALSLVSISAYIACQSEESTTADTCVKLSNRQTNQLFSEIKSKNPNLEKIKQLTCADASRANNLIKKELGMSALSVAAQNGQLDLLKFLVEEFLFDVNEEANEPSPLSIAALNGYPEIVAFLIKEGALVNQEDSTGKTPLFWTKTPEIAVMLILAGAKPFKRDNYGNIPFHLAARRGLAPMVKFFIKDLQVNVNARNNGKWTPLHDAGTPEVAEILLENGAEINALSDSGQTPLDSAIDSAKFNYYCTHPDKWFCAPGLAEYLIQHGAKTGEELKAEASKKEL